MVELLKRFLFDAEFFTARVRVVLFAIGTLLAQGVITLDILSEKLGPVGWWVGIGLSIAAVAVRAGDPTPAPIKHLSPEAVGALAKIGEANAKPPSGD